MALSEVDLAYLRSELGSDLDEPDLQARYDRLGSTPAVAAEVVQERLATRLSGPSAFSLPGVYSESTNDATIKALQEQAARLQGVLDTTAGVGVGGRIVRPDRVR